MAEGMYRCSKFMQHDFIMRSKMSVIKSKMGTIKSKIGRKFEQKKKSKMGKRKSKFGQGLVQTIRELVTTLLFRLGTCTAHTCSQR